MKSRKFSESLLGSFKKKGFKVKTFENIIESKIIIADETAPSAKQDANQGSTGKAIVSDSSDEENKKNFPAFRGPGGNGIAYQTNIPVDWDGPSGKNILWKIPVPAQGYNSPIIWNDKLFIAGASAIKREIFCYNRHDGKLLLSDEVGKVSEVKDH